MYLVGWVFLLSVIACAFWSVIVMGDVGGMIILGLFAVWGLLMTALMIRLRLRIRRRRARQAVARG